MFTFENVTYQDIIDIPEMTIEAGKITALTGDSGSGKTTLLKLMVKLISPSGGIIRYKGMNLIDLDPLTHRRQVVLLAQKPYLFKTSLRDNLLLGMSYHQKQVDDETLRQMLAKVELDKELDGAVDHFSGGEAQRLALARVMLLDADVYLLDEPASALDEESETIILNLLKELNQEKGKTIVMVSHHLNTIKAFADHTIKIAARRKKEARHDT
ncbi:MAG: ATP-binding cassette domain-containing protein [Acholeplasmataceae bacterium]|nr:MAG: ATP-binding cassette domain-containing protein [Acholeplasmataceae bacterium]